VKLLWTGRLVEVEIARQNLIRSLTAQHHLAPRRLNKQKPRVLDLDPGGQKWPNKKKNVRTFIEVLDVLFWETGGFCGSLLEA
jgi:hypothetical protein